MRNKEEIFRSDLSPVFNQLKDLNVKQIEEMSNEISNLIVGQQNRNSPSIFYATRKTNLDKLLEQPDLPDGIIDYLSKYLLDDGKFSESKLKDFKEAFRKVGKGYEEGGIIDYEITYKDTEKEDTINLNDINILVKKGESAFIGDKKDFENLLGKFSHLMSEKNQDIVDDVNIALDNHQRKKERLIGCDSALYSSVINGIDSFLSDFDEEKRHIVERLFKTYIELDEGNAESLASLSEGKVGVIYHILKQLRQANTKDELKGNLESVIKKFKDIGVNEIEEMNKEVSDLIKEQRITNQELTLFTTQKSNLEKEINSLDKRGLDFFRRYNVLDNNKFNESEFKYLKKVFRKIGKEIRDKKENIIDYKILYKNPRLGEENTIKSSDVEKFKELANSTSILNKKELKILLT